MSVNPYLPHVMVLPEDDANRQLAAGFHLEQGNTRQMYVLRPARGWTKVLEEFKSVHVGEMERDANRHMVLLIDFDDKEHRLDHAKRFVPAHLTDRVFIVGVWSKPERLGVGDKEKFGEELAKDCRDGTSKAWGHELLKHNAVEVDRLRKIVSPILF